MIILQLQLRVSLHMRFFDANDILFYAGVKMKLVPWPRIISPGISYMKIRTLYCWFIVEKTNLFFLFLYTQLYDSLVYLFYMFLFNRVVRLCLSV